MAATRHPPRPLVTAAPVEYYPENTWHDDMALGAGEIALATDLRGERPEPYLAAAAHWARAYIQHDAGDTFNLYDTSALAETDLVRAMRRDGHRPLALTPACCRDLRRQIAGGALQARPVRAGGDYDQFDVDSHTFGLISTVEMYDDITGSTAYQSFATAQRDWLFGANPWGASFMVGEGATSRGACSTRSPTSPAAATVRPPVARGAVVNGPNSAGAVPGGLGSRQDGMRKCPTDGQDPTRPSTGEAAGTSMTSGRGRPTSRPWT